MILCRLACTAGALAWLLALASPAVRAAPANLATAPAPKPVICYATTSAALVPLARLRGFYAVEGIDVELRPFPSGKQALEQLFAGACALATVAEVPVAHHAQRRGDFRIVAAISVSSNFERMVARGDRGILAPADLRGRRVAVPQFTTAHYFLDMFLATHGVAPQEVARVYLPADEVGPAFRRGEVDAAVQWEPAIQALAREFGPRAKVFTAPSLLVSPFLLVARLDWLRQNPAGLERVLRALLRAEHYLKEDAANARALIARHYGLSAADAGLILPLYDFRVALDQTLPFTLENAARWDSRLPQPPPPAMPNFLDLIHVDTLKKLRLAAVTLIH